MTRYQTNEAEKVIPLLNKCREHLDNAMYYMGEVEITDPQYKKCRVAYDMICKALDEF